VLVHAANNEMFGIELIVNRSVEDGYISSSW